MRDVRDYAAKKEEAERGMDEMSAKFKEVGGEIYVHPTGEKRVAIDQRHSDPSPAVRERAG